MSHCFFNPGEAKKRYPERNCPDQRAAVAQFLFATDPWPTFKKSCKLARKLCSARNYACICVNPSTGDRKFGDFKVPMDETYDCKGKIYAKTS
jgi:hypothetical protein